MKKFFRYIFYLLVLPFLVFFTNVNIGTHSNEFYKKFVDDLISNDSLSIKINLNDRQIVKSRISNQKTFKKNIVLGSSRSMLIGKPIHFEVDNYSVNGAIINDFENIYSHIKKENIKLDTVYLEISPWIFNENSKESRYKEFNESSFKRKIKKLFSLRYLIDNLHPKKYFPPQNEEDFVNYSDGSIKYDSKYRNQDNLKSIKNYAGKKDIYHLEGFNRIKKLKTSRLITLIERIIKDGSVPVLIKHPYPPMINSKISDRYPNIKLTEKIIDSLIEKFKIKSFGSFDSRKLNITNDDYYDGMHLTPLGVKKLLKLHK